MKRGAITKETSRLIHIWIPKALIPSIDQGVKKHDVDRSKYIRQAVREKLNRDGINQSA